MSIIEKIKRWLHDDGSHRSQGRDDLSASCRKLLDLYYLDEEERAGEVLAVGVYPEAERVVMFFYASVLRPHPAFSPKGYADRNIKVTFLGAVNAHASLNNRLLPDDELFDMSLGSINALEIKGSFPYSINLEGLHTHTFHLESDELVVDFAFDDLTFEEEPYLRTGSQPPA